MEPTSVALVIVDISGYTRFMLANRMALVHAQEIIAQLLESVIERADHPLVLNKLEGDAALLYAPLGGDPAAVARDVARQVDGFFDAFHARAGELARSRAMCPCDACRTIADLQLKAIAHAGAAAFRRIRQFEEMAGEDVILLHRLLKNTVANRQYFLMTDAFHRLQAGAAAGTPATRIETFDDLGAVAVFVIPRENPAPAPLPRPATRSPA